MFARYRARTRKRSSALAAGVPSLGRAAATGSASATAAAAQTADHAQAGVRAEPTKVGYFTQWSIYGRAFLVKNLGTSGAAKQLTFGTIQGYDPHGSYEPRTDHQSAIRSPQGDPWEKKWSIDKTVNPWVDASALPEKMLLGVLFSGRGWSGVPDANDGLLQKSARLAPGAGGRVGSRTTRCSSPAPVSTPSSVPRRRTFAWRFDGTTFWTYDDPTEIERAVDYLRNKGLGGAMAWSMNGDTPRGGVDDHPGSRPRLNAARRPDRARSGAGPGTASSPATRDRRYHTPDRPVGGFVWSSLVSARYHPGMAMTLRLTDEESQRLAELAAAEGRSKQEIMRSALDERWARQHKDEQLDEVLHRVLPRYRGLLDKLGPA